MGQESGRWHFPSVCDIKSIDRGGAEEHPGLSSAQAPSDMSSTCLDERIGKLTVLFILAVALGKIHLILF